VGNKLPEFWLHLDGRICCDTKDFFLTALGGRADLLLNLGDTEGALRDYYAVKKKGNVAILSRTSSTLIFIILNT
tara:strand:- start:1528 stop:1752 length:225 start_codon:yes stop_codon:yes gene_type:complete